MNKWIAISYLFIIVMLDKFMNTNIIGRLMEMIK